MMHLNAANLDSIARQLRALNKDMIDVPYFTVDGHTIVVEQVEVGGQMGPERTYIITDIKPCDGC
jgi:hypothetical protein